MRFHNPGTLPWLAFGRQRLHHSSEMMNTVCPRVRWFMTAFGETWVDALEPFSYAYASSWIGDELLTLQDGAQGRQKKVIYAWMAADLDKSGKPQFWAKIGRGFCTRVQDITEEQYRSLEDRMRHGPPGPINWPMA